MRKPAVFIQNLSGRGSGQNPTHLAILQYYSGEIIGDDRNPLSLSETLLGYCLRSPVRKVDFPLQSLATFYTKREK